MIKTVREQDYVNISTLAAYDGEDGQPEWEVYRGTVWAVDEMAIGIICDEITDSWEKRHAFDPPRSWIIPWSRVNVITDPREFDNDH